MSSSDSPHPWQAAPGPEWLRSVNQEGRYLDLPAVVPLDEASLLEAACKATGLDDFGDELWRLPFHTLVRALEEEAELTLMGRLMARSDIVLWLSTRLKVVNTLGKHPEILDAPIESPMFIVGLPRSGTSILFELLSQDPEVGVPLMWEALQPCPPPEASTYQTDSRIQQAHDLFTQWNRVAPTFATMHEMRGDIPAECGLLMAGTFISDHIASLHQTPSYSAVCSAADYKAVYAYHKQILQILQWKNPRRRWLLKAPEHQVHLDTLLEVYPDASIVQTHRDPIKCMASTTSLIGTLYKMRSDKAFDASLFENIILGEATARRLEQVMVWREQGIVPEASIVDSRFQDLMEDPIRCVNAIYAHFKLELTPGTKQAMLAYLSNKPRGKFGAHDYAVSREQARDRELFRRYQDHYRIPDET